MAPSQRWAYLLRITYFFCGGYLIYALIHPSANFAFKEFSEFGNTKQRHVYAKCVQRRVLQTSIPTPC
jgi:hypothetical protein